MCRSSSSSLALPLCLMLWANLPAAAGGSQTDASEPTLGTTLRVYNYARVAPEVLAKAEKEAERVFRKVGVHLEWLHCPFDNEELKNFPACQQEIGATDLILDILTQFKTENSNLRGTSLGFAHLERSTAHVSLLRVKHLAQFGYASEPEVLGHAIAHELGHLLLNSNLHSASGIMQANWGPKELQAAANEDLAFTQEQAKRIRGKVVKADAGQKQTGANASMPSTTVGKGQLR
jgi:hypothetical protein